MPAQTYSLAAHRNSRPSGQAVRRSPFVAVERKDGPCRTRSKPRVRRSMRSPAPRSPAGRSPARCARHSRRLMSEAVLVTSAGAVQRPDGIAASLAIREMPQPCARRVSNVKVCRWGSVAREIRRRPRGELVGDVVRERTRLFERINLDPVRVSAERLLVAAQRAWLMPSCAVLSMSRRSAASRTRSPRS